MEHLNKIIKLAEELKLYGVKIQPGMSYGSSRDVRKICQQLKISAQALRLNVNEYRKQ